MTDKIIYELTGLGWASFSIIPENQKGIGFTFSYLSDPLNDLLAGLNRLCEKTTNFEFISFSQEPGEIFLMLERENENEINIEFYFTNDLNFETDVNKIKNSFEKIYFDKDELKNFATKIFDETNKLLENYGEKGYFEKWAEYEFPIQSFKKLELFLEKNYR